MFFNTSTAIVNLQNVSNINVQYQKNRIIFNMGYTIGISSDPNKRISDYIYWDFENPDEFEEALDRVKTTRFIDVNYIRISHFFINKNQISSIKFLQKDKRIVFNMSHPVTFKGKNGEQLTSEFIYVDSGTQEEFEAQIKYVKERL